MVLPICLIELLLIMAVCGLPLSPNSRASTRNRRHPRGTEILIVQQTNKIEKLVSPAHIQLQTEHGKPNLQRKSWPDQDTIHFVLFVLSLRPLYPLLQFNSINKQCTHQVNPLRLF